MNLNEQGVFLPDALHLQRLHMDPMAPYHDLLQPDPITLSPQEQHIWRELIRIRIQRISSRFLRWMAIVQLLIGIKIMLLDLWLLPLLAFQQQQKQHPDPFFYIISLNLNALIRGWKFLLTYLVLILSVLLIDSQLDLPRAIFMLRGLTPPAPLLFLLEYLFGYYYPLDSVMSFSANVIISIVLSIVCMIISEMNKIY